MEACGPCLAVTLDLVGLLRGPEGGTLPFQESDWAEASVVVGVIDALRARSFEGRLLVEDPFAMMMPGPEKGGFEGVDP